MFTIKKNTRETEREEELNVTSHVIGLGGSMIAASLVYLYATSPAGMLAGMLFCMSSILTYASSALYHGVDNTKLKSIFYVLDCSSIYILIASTAGSFLIVAPHSLTVYVFISTIFALALLGVTCKIYFRHAHLLLFALSYVAFGWLVMMLAAPYVTGLPSSFVLAGGMCYSLGVVAYLSSKVMYSHFVWHIAVLLGSACNFVALMLVI